MFPIRNIAILAHVDAGKTTLSERILFSAGEVRLPGDVEDGLATMDYLPEERKRGITIESGVAHFEWRKLWFNFIDTPGHVDFGAEVDMALSAVDGAVLVISAVDGVETQTLSAWKKLRSKGIRTLIFINKLDNPNCALDDTLIAIEEHLGVRPVLLSSPEFSEANSSVSQIQSELDVISGMRLVLENGKEEPQKLSANDVAQTRLNEMTKEAVEAASEYDDEILELALNGETVPPKMLLRGLSALAAADKYVLCYAGSAKQNLGVRSLMTGLSFRLRRNFPKNISAKWCGSDISRIWEKSPFSAAWRNFRTIKFPRALHFIGSKRPRYFRSKKFSPATFMRCVPKIVSPSVNFSPSKEMRSNAKSKTQNTIRYYKRGSNACAKAIIIKSQKV